jgi:L-fuconolactonase
MRIDAHQHFWTYDREDYEWIPAGSPLVHDFLPEDLERELDACGLDGCVAVQARQSLEESRWLLKLAEQAPRIRGVVGWVDLRSPQVEQQLEELAPHPRFVGVRHVVQDEPDDNFMLGAEFQRGIGLLQQYDLTYDILIYPKQLPAALRLAGNFPEQPFVLDHLAKPLIKDAVIEPWASMMRDLAKHPNVYCKVSGMVTEARLHGWEPKDFVPYLDVVLQAFGPERLMYGSDWPVALLAGSYQQVYRLAAEYFEPLGPATLAAVFGDNAARFYGLPSE